MVKRISIYLRKSIKLIQQTDWKGNNLEIFLQSMKQNFHESAIKVRMTTCANKVRRERYWKCPFHWPTCFLKWWMRRLSSNRMNWAWSSCTEASNEPQQTWSSPLSHTLLSTIVGMRIAICAVSRSKSIWWIWCPITWYRSRLQQRTQSALYSGTSGAPHTCDGRDTSHSWSQHENLLLSNPWEKANKAIIEGSFRIIDVLHKGQWKTRFVMLLCLEWWDSAAELIYEERIRRKGGFHLIRWIRVKISSEDVNSGCFAQLQQDSNVSLLEEARDMLCAVMRSVTTEIALTQHYEIVVTEMYELTIALLNKVFLDGPSMFPVRQCGIPLQPTRRRQGHCGNLCEL